MKQINAEILNLKTKNSSEYLFVKINVRTNEFYCL